MSENARLDLPETDLPAAGLPLESLAEPPTAMRMAPAWGSRAQRR